MSDRLITVRRALADAPADTIVESLGQALDSDYGITDADLLLGYLDPERYADGRIPLSIKRSKRAIWSSPLSRWP